MPTHLTARPPLDAREARQVRKLAHSVHAPADWMVHAKLVAHSWDGLRTNQIAEVLHCHPQTVRERLHAFNARGLDEYQGRRWDGLHRHLALVMLAYSFLVVQSLLPRPSSGTDGTLFPLSALSSRPNAARCPSLGPGLALPGSGPVAAPDRPDQDLSASENLTK